MTLIFNRLRAMVMTYLQAKVQGQRSVGSEDRVDEQTDGQTEAIPLPPTLMRSAKNVKSYVFWILKNVITFQRPLNHFSL